MLRFAVFCIPPACPINWSTVQLRLPSSVRSPRPWHYDPRLILSRPQFPSQCWDTWLRQSPNQLILNRATGRSGPLVLEFSKKWWVNQRDWWANWSISTFLKKGLFLPVTKFQHHLTWIRKKIDHGFSQVLPHWLVTMATINDLSPTF